MRLKFTVLTFFVTLIASAQELTTTFEKSAGLETATYADCIAFYKKLAATSNNIQVKTFGNTDAGYPLHLVIFSNDKSFSPISWQQQNKLVVLVNNGIHPGEPDGIDASMMLLRDIVKGKIVVPSNVILAIIPIYNIGGSLNRGSFSRVNQDGPLTYGFRGNAQNLDLNRDFTKSDSRNAKAFAQIFHYLNPDIFIDNHVSDGADYQHTMTLLTTQHSKLGGSIGNYLHATFEPSIFKSMASKNWPLTPYVNFEEGSPEKGWQAFYDAPRYSTGYAALFGTIGFMPETHMLKPFAQRVKSDYALMESILQQAILQANAIKQSRKESLESIKHQQSFALNFVVDSTRKDTITFLGYTAEQKKSDVTGMNRLFYNHEQPFSKQVGLYNYFVGQNMVQKPKAYIIPQGWHDVIDLLKLNHVATATLAKDTQILVDAYRIEDFKTSPHAYEKHYRHSNTKVSITQQKIQFLKGDCIIYTGQIYDRFLVEMLEPTGDDSYFAWNFFDAILQQKEGYSDYRWEDIAAKYLQLHPELQEEMAAKRQADPKFAASASQQLDFVYKHSPYYEPAHLRYPIYRLVQ
ncbi:M14 family metallopeptidase [Parasediminibacterium paludis]|uniref:M14 family metallopeptidase n=1 Tax=Parasediminibacterium paludis TaxID=908966 RepID=A0ABV8PUC5_9BACT